MKNLTLLAALAFCFQVFSQAPDIIWRNFQGSIFDDVYSEVAVNNSGDIYVGGYLNTNAVDIGGYGGNDFWLLKFSLAGELIWDHKFGGSLDDRCYAMSLLSNGNICMAGITNSNDHDVSEFFGAYDVWVITVSPDGELLWETTFGTTQYERGFDIIELTTGEIAVAISNAAYNMGMLTFDQSTGELDQ